MLSSPPPTRHNPHNLPSPPRHQIRTDTSAVYGDGFRRALELYQLRGLRALFDHVLRARAWPVAWEA